MNAPLRIEERPTTLGGMEACVLGDTIAIRDDAGQLLLSVSDGGVVRLLAVRRIELDAPEIRLRSESLEVDAGQTRWSVGRWELRAKQLVERAGDVLRHAEGLYETRARRARWLVDRTLELRSRRTFVASEQDTRIDGKRVLLG